MQKIEYTLSTLEVAEMLETAHWQLLRKLEGRTDKTGKHVKGYIEILGDNQMVVTDFFVKSTYLTEQNKEQPCYQVTKLGCDFLANKFTGEKGVLFTARYVKRFHEMEEQLQKENHMDWYVNDIRVFQSREFGILRTLKLDGQDYFIGIDATRSLGYVNNTDALKKRVSNPEKCYVRICDGKMNRNMVAITRKGMDELVQTGRLPLAGKYNEWLCKQVYPALDGREVIPVKQSVEKIPEQKEVIPVKCTTEQVKSGYVIPDMKNPMFILKNLLALAKEENMKIEVKDLKGYASMLCENRIALRRNLTFEKAVYETAYELAHHFIHYNQGNMIESPLSKDYNEQAERAASMIIRMLDIKKSIV